MTPAASAVYFKSVTGPSPSPGAPAPVTIDGMIVAVASHSFGKNPTLRRELLERYSGAIFNDTGHPLAGEALVRFLHGHERAITGLEVLDEALFQSLPGLRLVSKYGVGLDMIDLPAARRHGVSVRWTPGVNRQSVAELTIAFMLALGRTLVDRKSVV